MRTIRLVLFAVLFAAIGLPQAKAVLVTPVNPAQQEADALAAAQEYQASLKAMSAKERRELRREQRHSMRNALKDFKKGDQSQDGANTVVLGYSCYLHSTPGRIPAPGRDQWQVLDFPLAYVVVRSCLESFIP